MNSRSQEGKGGHAFLRIGGMLRPDKKGIIYYPWHSRRCPRHAVVRARAPLLPLLHASAFRRCMPAALSPRHGLVLSSQPTACMLTRQAVTVNRNLATAAQREAVRRLATPCVPASDPAGVVVVAKAVELRLWRRNIGRQMRHAEDGNNYLTRS